MARRVIDLLNNHEGRTFFFAFGTGHFIGEGSVVDILRSAGFNVKRLSPSSVVRTNNSKATDNHDLVNQDTARTTSLLGHCRCDYFATFAWVVCIAGCVFGSWNKNIVNAFQPLT